MPTATGSPEGAAAEAGLVAEGRQLPAPEQGPGGMSSVVLGGQVWCLLILSPGRSPPLLHGVEGPTAAVAQLLTLGTPVVGGGDAFELLLPCCVPAVQWERERGTEGGRLNNSSGLGRQASGVVGGQTKSLASCPAAWASGSATASRPPLPFSSS